MFEPHESLAHQAHRPWALPKGPWIMQQTWEQLLFAHWPVPLSALRAHVPDALEIDTFEGQAWIGVVPFYMAHVKPRFLPSVPALSFFAELNVRTYVTYQGKPGVWFFSLEASNPLAVAIARKGFHLPYFNAHMRCYSQQTSPQHIRYYSQRTHKGASAARFEAEYGPTAGVKLAIKGTLDHWLTERYALYSQSKAGQLYCGEIHHGPWPLQAAEADISVNTMTAGISLALPDTPPLLHYAERIAVVVWPLQAQ